MFQPWLRPEEENIGSHGFWLLLLLVVAVHGARQFYLGGVEFLDGDSWLHALRVRELLDGFPWSDPQVHRANAPYGFALHWTRLFDIILAAIALPLVPVVGLDQAVVLAGFALGPLFHVGAVLSLSWATRPLLGHAGALLAAALAVFQPAIIEATTPGVVDHHGLILVLTVVFLGMVVRVLADDGDRWVTRTGIVTAMMSWAGVETLVPIIMFLVMVLVLHVAGNREIARRGSSMLLVAMVTAMPILLLEQGSGGFIQVEFDRFSILHAGLLLVGGVSLSDLGMVGTQSVLRRTVLAAMIVVGAGVFSVKAMPMAVGPDLEFNAWFFSGVVEFAPLGGWRSFVFTLGGGLPVVVWLLWRLRMGRELSQQPAWVLVTLLLVAYFILALMWRRWAFLAQMLIAVGAADLLLAVFRNAGRRWVPTTIVGLILVFVPPGIGLAAGLEWKRMKPDCDVSALSHYLSSERFPEPLTIMASAHDGPEILYRTPHRVVATMHHRNAQGIKDMLRVFRSPYDDVAVSVIRKRHVDMLAICPVTHRSDFNAPFDSPRLLYRRLLAGDLPAWIVQDDVSLDTTGGYRVYRVLQEGR
jgi:asparagine N-glycosylation enzyme membrane subunit Stt3